MTALFPIPPANIDPDQIRTMADLFVEVFQAPPELANQVAEMIVTEFDLQVRTMVGALAEQVGTHLYGSPTDEVSH